MLLFHIRKTSWVRINYYLFSNVFSCTFYIKIIMLNWFSLKIILIILWSCKWIILLNRSWISYIISKSFSISLLNILLLIINSAIIISITSYILINWYHIIHLIKFTLILRLSTLTIIWTLRSIMNSIKILTLHILLSKWWQRRIHILLVKVKILLILVCRRSSLF
jgi:hypothetical protein